MNSAQKKEYIKEAHSDEVKKFKHFSEDQLLHIISKQTLKEMHGMTLKKKQETLINHELFKDFKGKLSLYTLTNIYKYFKLLENEWNFRKLFLIFRFMGKVLIKINASNLKFYKNTKFVIYSSGNFSHIWIKMQVNNLIKFNNHSIMRFYIKNI